MLEILYLVVLAITWFLGVCYFARKCWDVDNTFVALLCFLMVYVYGIGQPLLGLYVGDLIFH